MRSGVIGLFSQNLILMGVFFVIPLYLQLVLGLTALETGVKMLPISITMFATAAIGAKLSNRFPVRTIVRGGLLVTIAGVLVLLATIQPALADAGFAIGMAVLGVGMGLMISQLGNVIQSSVDESGRSEAGGLQFTGQQLGSALGVAFIGSIVLIGLTSTFISTVENDPRVSHRVGDPARCGCGVQHQLRLVQRNRKRRSGRRHRRGHHRGAGRRLRDSPAPITQGRSPRCRASGPRLPRIHQGASTSATCVPKDADCRRCIPTRRPGRIGRCDKSSRGVAVREHVVEVSFKGEAERRARGTVRLPCGDRRSGRHAPTRSRETPRSCSGSWPRSTRSGWS